VNLIKSKSISLPWVLFACVSAFFFFESIQMSYFDIAAPYFIAHHWYTSGQVGSLSAAYYYGNVIGVIPAGQLLDKKNIRKILLYAIGFSVLASIIFAFTNQFLIGWLARFASGFFGGAYCFLGGIKVLARAFPKRFTFVIGLFITVGMLAGMTAQLPLLWVIKWTGGFGVLIVVAFLGLIVLCINWFYLHPAQVASNSHISDKNNNLGWWNIISNWRNFGYGLLISAISTPISVLGNLWGVVVLTDFYHFPDTVSASIMMLLFFGLMVGSPIVGELADRFNITGLLMIFGCFGSLLVILLLIMLSHSLSVFDVALCFLGLGLLGSCQTLVYGWLKRDNDIKIISRVTALNSIILMGMSGVVKQISAELMQLRPWFGLSQSTGNLLVMIAVAMILALILTTLVVKKS
jgi:MFS family permease